MTTLRRKSYVYPRTCVCSFVFLLFRTLYFNFIPFFFFQGCQHGIHFIYRIYEAEQHLVLHILSNPRIYIVVLLYISLSNPNISIGLYRCLFFSLLSLVDNHPCFINVRMCLFLCSAHIELGH